MQQFNQFYLSRLEQLKPAVKEAAEMKWDQNAEYVDNILDLTAGKLTVIIGTLLKDQDKKASVFANLGGVIKALNKPVDVSFGLNVLDGSEDLIGLYTSENDKIFVEDGSGRIKIATNADGFPHEQLVTGTIIALLGLSDREGCFHVKDTCLAGIPFEPELPPNVEIKARGLFENSLLHEGARKFLAFTSGLNFGHLGDEEECRNAMLLLASFLKGQHLNAKMNKVAAQVTRLVICGDSVREHDLADEVNRGSYRTQKQNKT